MFVSQVTQGSVGNSGSSGTVLSARDNGRPLCSGRAQASEYGLSSQAANMDESSHASQVCVFSFIWGSIS